MNLESAIIRRVAQVLCGLGLGVAASVLWPGRHGTGLSVVSTLGMAGAWVAGRTGERLRLYRAEQPAGFVMASLGAILFLLIYAVFLR